MASNGSDARPSSRTSKTPIHTNPLLADAARLVQQRQQAAQQARTDADEHYSPNGEPPCAAAVPPTNKRKHSPIPWPESGAKAARTVTFASASQQHSGSSPQPSQNSGDVPSRSEFSSRWADELEAPEPTVQQQEDSQGPAPGPALPGPGDGLDPALVYGEEIDQVNSSDGEGAGLVEEAAEEEEPEEPPIPVWVCGDVLLCEQRLQLGVVLGASTGLRCAQLPSMLNSCRDVECFERLNKINEGAYGVVFRARDKESGRICALKKVCWRTSPL